ncbi:MAG TPA: SCO family protein [Gemmatimonadales bacterium]|nr:SCO family protein [Gemmatimonadales bacterium]
MIRRSLLGVLVAGALLGCARGPEGSEFHGVVLPVPFPRPQVTLTATDGRPFDFAAATRGRVTFLFFGYTHCPDVCPVHMANLAAVLKDLTHEDRDRVQVVFVTTDPARDSAQVLRRWLDQFDPTFIGLRGDDSTVARFEAEAHVAAAVKEAPTDSNAGYTVGHAAQVIAFASDDSAHVLYPFGTRQEDWAHDIPLLLGGAWSGK